MSNNDVTNNNYDLEQGANATPVSLEYVAGALEGSDNSPTDNSPTDNNDPNATPTHNPSYSYSFQIILAAMLCFIVVTTTLVVMFDRPSLWRSDIEPVVNASLATEVSPH